MYTMERIHPLHKRFYAMGICLAGGRTKHDTELVSALHEFTKKRIDKFLYMEEFEYGLAI